MAGKAAKTALTWVIVLAGVGLGGCGGDDGDTTVPAPSTADRQAMVAELARASAAQGICYGWQLDDGLRTVSRGSNLGENAPVDSDTGRCAKWVEVRAVVTYPDVTSESDDSATVSVVASPNLNLTSAIDSWLARFDLTGAAFVNDPALAISRAALALPLLAAEAGAAEPAPSASVAPTDAAQALEPPGSDFWRDRLVYVVVAFVLVLVGGLFVSVGFIQRRAASRPR